MAFDIKEEVSETGKNLVSREGWLGWVLIVASALLAFYVWQSWSYNERLLDVLKTTQDLQKETLDDRKLKTDVIMQQTKAIEILGDRALAASSNLTQLVNLVSAGYIFDEKRTDNILQKLREVRDASEMTAKEVKILREKIKE